MNNTLQHAVLKSRKYKFQIVQQQYSAKIFLCNYGELGNMTFELVGAK